MKLLLLSGLLKPLLYWSLEFLSSKLLDFLLSKFLELLLSKLLKLLVRFFYEILVLIYFFVYFGLLSFGFESSCNLEKFFKKISLIEEFLL